MSSPGSSFSIDLERAPQAIAELKAAREELRAVKDQAQALGKVDPGSRDSVSIDAAAVLSAVAVSGPRSLLAVITSGIAQIDQLIAAMERDIDDHRATDASNADAFRP